MINVSSAFLQEMYVNDNRKFSYTIDVAFADGTTDTLTGEDLYTGGITIEDSVSDDSELSLGYAAINQCTLILQNFDEQWNDYDFIDAEITVYIGLEVNGSEERFQKGIFTVTEQNYNGVLLTLTAMDRMSQFEIDYLDNSTLSYPATIAAIVQDACTVCGVPLASAVFPHSYLSISAFEVTQGITFRSVISWAAMCCGCNARINRFGQLEFVSYDFEFLEWFPESRLDDWTEETALLAENGNTLITESGNDIILDNSKLNVFPSLYSMESSTRDISITGVVACVENPDSTSAANAITTYLYGSDGYVINLEDNPLITKRNGRAVADFVGLRMANHSYRKASFSHLSDPLVEAGDMAIIVDGKGRVYRVLVSSTTFRANDRQLTTSAGASPPRTVTSAPANRSVGAATPQIITGKNANRYSPGTEAYIRAMRSIQPKLDAMGGLYETDVDDGGGGLVRYLHNKKELSESDIQIVVSTNGIQVTANGLDDEPTWYGMTVDGNFIANLLSVNGISASWITSGAFVIRDDDDNEIFRADKTGKVFRWNMDYSSMSQDGDLIVYDKNGNASVQVSASKDSIVRGTTLTSSSVETTDGVNVNGAWLNNYYLAKMTPKGISIVYHDISSQENYTVLEVKDMRSGSYETDSGTEINGYSLEDRIKNTLDSASSSSASLSKPSSLTNFTFGTTWTCGVRRKSGVVMLHYSFNGYFTATSTTGGTLFTLTSAYRPPTTLYFNRVNQSGTRYLLTVNTNGTVTLQNTSGASASSAQFFRDVVTFLNG